jgi:predicted acylesterase/phospholipase RssA
MAEPDLLELANRILRGQQTNQLEIFKLAEVLKNRWKRFGRARQLLWLARSDSKTVVNRSSEARFNVKLRQQHALCTYKDNDLAADIRFERALGILNQCDDLASSTNQETLGLAGAIFKAQWEVFGQIQHLERSLLYYQKGWSQGTNDDGYTGINTAYILDLIAYQEDLQAIKSGVQSASAAQRRASAKQIRQKIVEALPAVAAEVEKRSAQPYGDVDEKEGEAYLGLGLDDDQRFEAGKDCLSKAAKLGRYDWMVESSARQLASLVRLLSPRNQAGPADGSRPWLLIEALLGSQAPGVRSAFVGKVGLALSGGGFRASFFHIGVLARLAEMDVLRHVEYLSCVSGGSIVGAYYYLEVRELLQRKCDGDISRQDYIDIVKNIEREFLAGVQQNIRIRSLTSFKTNFHHDLTCGVLPSERTAELYDELLYSRIEHVSPERPRHLDELIISPGLNAEGNCPGKKAEFRPKDENWRRVHKVPILVLNCTTLNTGHNWQFTATWMGEPPATINNEVDANQRLRRMYHSEAPDAYKKFLLSRAVAASASVPALFAPLALAELYPNMTVRLADGGVHDNQGVASLLEQNCTVLLVSDASGQLPDASDPGRRALQIAVRADDIVQERVRVSQYQDLESRLRSSLLRSLMFLHLRKGLDSDPLDWIGCLDPYDASDEARPAAQKGVLTPYGIHKNVQRRIAAIRTDLDSFHEAEAYALMTSGYKMADFHFPSNLQDARDPDDLRVKWCFLRLEGEMAKGASPLLDLLTLSSQRLFKIWELVPALRRIRTALAIALALAGILITLRLLLMRSTALFTLRSDWLAKSILVLVLAAIIGKAVAWIMNPRSELQKLAIRSALAVSAVCFAWIHLRFFDRWYLRRGELKNVLADGAVPPCEEK